AHRAGRALDLLHRALDVDGVEVRHLDLGDLADLIARHAAGDLGLDVRCRLVDPSRLAQQIGSRRRLGDEAEGAIFVDGDDDRDDLAHLPRRTFVVLLAEIHDRHTMLTERRANRRRRRRFAGRYLELDVRAYFLGHEFRAPR